MPGSFHLAKPLCCIDKAPIVVFLTAHNPLCICALPINRQSKIETSLFDVKAPGCAFLPLTQLIVCLRLAA